jgi:hypothetical protein
MTGTALVRRSDLKRLADIAKVTGMRVEIVVNGVIVRVDPDIPNINKPERVELPDDFAL